LRNREPDPRNSLNSRQGEDFDNANPDEFRVSDDTQNPPKTGKNDGVNPEPETGDRELWSRIEALREEGLTKKQIILALWGAKPGGSQAWKEASDRYDNLIAKFGGND